MTDYDKLEAVARLRDKWDCFDKALGELTFAVGNCEVELPKEKYDEIYSDMEKAYGPSTGRLVYRTTFGRVIIREKRT
jgi:hypothetical protein